MKLKEDIQLSENFKINEFLSNNDTQTISQKETLNVRELVDRLQELRKIVDVPMTINSGFRGVAYNKSVNGSSNSYHLTGLAADIKFDFSDWDRNSMTKLLKYLGFTNVNFYWNKQRTSWVWIHVDLGKAWNGAEFNYRDMDATTKKEIKL